MSSQHLPGSALTGYQGSNHRDPHLVVALERVLDAHGGMVTPGFIDSYVHFLEGGLRLGSVQLRDARSKAAFVARIKAFAATVPPGTWITGGDWDHQNWGGDCRGRNGSTRRRRRIRCGSTAWTAT